MTDLADLMTLVRQVRAENLRALGLDEDADRVMEIGVDEPAHLPSNAPPGSTLLTLDPLDGSSLLAVNRGVGHAQILNVHPKHFQDMTEVARAVSAGVAVIVNLSSMKEAEARRSIDFVSGVVEGVGGVLERVTNKVFVVTPRKVHSRNEAFEEPPATQKRTRAASRS